MARRKTTQRMVFLKKHGSRLDLLPARTARSHRPLARCVRARAPACTRARAHARAVHPPSARPLRAEIDGCRPKRDRLPTKISRNQLTSTGFGPISRLPNLSDVDRNWHALGIIRPALRECVRPWLCPKGSSSGSRRDRIKSAPQSFQHRALSANFRANIRASSWLTKPRAMHARPP